MLTDGPPGIGPGLSSLDIFAETVGIFLSKLSNDAVMVGISIFAQLGDNPLTVPLTQMIRV